MTINKNFLITTNIFNEIEDVTHKIFSEEYEENYELVRKLAENETGLHPDEIESLDENEFENMINEEINSIISIKRINVNSVLFDALRQYFYKDISNVNGYRIEFYQNVRSCVFEGDHMYYVTGCGYDTISSDLLGKNADGTEKYNFIEWLNN